MIPIAVRGTWTFAALALRRCAGDNPSQHPPRTADVIHRRLYRRDQRILAGYRAGATLPELCLAEEVAPQVVRRVLRAAGITPDDGRDTRLPSTTVERLADSAWLAAAYATKSTPEIADALGCFESAVLQALREAGIARRPREEYMPKARGIEPWPPEVVDQVLQCYAGGKSVKAVAEELGLPHKRVYRLLRERGVLRTQAEGGEQLGGEVLARYAAGESGTAIARSLGRPEKSVYRLLRNHTLNCGSGVLRSHKEAGRLRAGAKAESAPHACEEMPAELAENIVARYVSGEPAGLVAAAVGVSEKRVYRLLRRRGVLRSLSEARRAVWARRKAAEG